MQHTCGCVCVRALEYTCVSVCVCGHDHETRPTSHFVNEERVQHLGNTDPGTLSTPTGLQGKGVGGGAREVGVGVGLGKPE